MDSKELREYFIKKEQYFYKKNFNSNIDFSDLIKDASSILCVKCIDSPKLLRVIPANWDLNFVLPMLEMIYPIKNCLGIELSEIKSNREPSKNYIICLSFCEFCNLEKIGLTLAERVLLEIDSYIRFRKTFLSPGKTILCTGSRFEKNGRTFFPYIVLGEEKKIYLNCSSFSNDFLQPLNIKVIGL